MKYGQLETLYRVCCGKCRVNSVNGFDAKGRLDAGRSLKREGWAMTRAWGWVCRPCNLDIVEVSVIQQPAPDEESEK